MATNASSFETKSRSRPDIVGRSPATGKLVLKPASKPGQVSDAEVREAVRAVIQMRKADQKHTA